MKATNRRDTSARRPRAGPPRMRVATLFKRLLRLGGERSSGSRMIEDEQGVEQVVKKKRT